VLTSEVRHNVFLAFKEALHNVVKHASATEVRVSLEVFPNAFALTVTDNGCGFTLPEANVSAARRQPGSPGRLAAGNGLLNMRKRLEEVGGQCRWESAPGAGTKVRFTIQV
jgi:signal transduction histidine kinase